MNPMMGAMAVMNKKKQDLARFNIFFVPLKVMFKDDYEWDKFDLISLKKYKVVGDQLHAKFIYASRLEISNKTFKAHEIDDALEYFNEAEEFSAFIAFPVSRDDVNSHFTAQGFYEALVEATYDFMVKALPKKSIEGLRKELSSSSYEDYTTEDALEYLNEEYK